MCGQVSQGLGGLWVGERVSKKVSAFPSPGALEIKATTELALSSCFPLPNPTIAASKLITVRFPEGWTQPARLASGLIELPGGVALCADMIR